MKEDLIITDKLPESQINQLLELYKNESWSKNRELKDIKIMLENSNIIALINKSNEELIAFARFLSDFVYRAVIYDVIVSKKYRGLGYGRIILEEIIKHKILKNVERVELYCIDHNVTLYEKFSFKKVEGVNLMRKNLEQI